MFLIVETAKLGMMYVSEMDMAGETQWYAWSNRAQV